MIIFVRNIIETLVIKPPTPMILSFNYQDTMNRIKAILKNYA